MYDNLSLLYYNLNDYDNAKKYLLELEPLPVFPVPYFHKMRVLINTTNTLGEVYRNTSLPDSALYFFEKAYHIAKKAKDSIWVAIAGGNIGAIYFLQKKYAEAIPLLEKDSRLSIETGDNNNAAKGLTKLAQINMIYKNNVKALQQVLQARTLTDNSYYKLLGELYALMAKLYAAEGNMTLAYQYYDSALIAKDSIFKQTNAISLTRAELKTTVEQHLAAVRELENQKKIRTLQRNGLICLIVLMIIITILLINRQRLLKKEKLYAQAQQQQAIKELIAAKQQLNSFTTNIREKNELVDRLTTELTGLQSTLNEEAKAHRQETLKQLRKSTILTDEEWEAFKISFETVYPSWFKELNKKLPGLSSADLRFLALTRLKFTSREMAAVLGISPASLRMSRHRLRKKYDLSEEEMAEFLAENV